MPATLELPLRTTQIGLFPALGAVWDSAPEAEPAPAADTDADTDTDTDAEGEMNKPTSDWTLQTCRMGRGAKVHLVWTIPSGHGWPLCGQPSSLRSRVHHVGADSEATCRSCLAKRPVIYVTTYEDGEEASRGTRSDYIDANPDDPEVAEAMDRLDAGEASVSLGGGAASLLIMTRLA